MVRRVHRRPQFVEDVVRDVLAEIVTQWAGYSDGLKLSVQARSFESIHGHDIEAEANMSLGELRQLVESDLIVDRQVAG
jgi:GTP cyclohydrolase FolE2